MRVFVNEADLGTCVLRRMDGVVEMLRADPVIAISRDLLVDQDFTFMQVHGDADVVVLLGEYVYRATGQTTRRGDPVYVADESNPVVATDRSTREDAPPEGLTDAAETATWEGRSA